MLEERVNSATSAVRQYVWSLAYIDGMVLRDDNSTSGNLGISGSGLGRRLYVQQDGNWNVTALINTSGAVQERIVYDPYGNNLFLDASGSPTTDSFTWIYLHQGGRLELNTGLYLFRHRDYSAALGRWMQQDPLNYIDGASLYQMVNSNPVNFIDPNGLQQTDPPNLPGHWVWQPDPGNKRGGVWRDQNTGRTASWEYKDSHWDVDDGCGNRTRYDGRGNPLAEEQAHNPPRKKTLPPQRKCSCPCGKPGCKCALGTAIDIGALPTDMAIVAGDIIARLISGSSSNPPSTQPTTQPSGGSSSGGGGGGDWGWPHFPNLLPPFDPGPNIHPQY